MKTKRIVCSAISVVIAILVLSSALISSAQSFTVDHVTGVTNILEGLSGNITSRVEGRSGSLADEKVNSGGVDVLTDGYIYHSAGSGKPQSYINIPICISGTEVAYNEAGGDYSFTGIDKKYFYFIEYSNLIGDAGSFAFYICGDQASGKDVPVYQCDASFDILVSTDGGATYKVAWSSVDYVVDFSTKANGQVLRCAGEEASNGGNMVFASGVDELGKTVTYRYVIANFNDTYVGATNVVYACSNLRRNGNQDKPFYYCARISEFKVFDNALPADKLTPAPSEVTIETKTVTTEAVTTEAVTTGGIPVITADPTDTMVETTEYKAFTAAPKTTAAPETTSAPETTQASEEKKGCGSSVSLAGIAVLCACSFVFIKKKH